MKRREFSKAVKVEIIQRSTRSGVTYCEECGIACRRWDIDHTIPEELVIDKSKPLTADDGQLLCSGSRETCHGRKTAERDIPTIAKVKRAQVKHFGVDGKPTPLSGRTRAERDEAKAARGRATRPEGKPPVPSPRSVYADIGGRP